MSGFDPKAFLAEEDGPAFDPKAFLSDDAEPKVGAGETFLNRTGKALPLGHQAAGVGSSAWIQIAKALGWGEPAARLTPRAAAEAKTLGIPYEEPKNVLPGPMDAYRQAVDTMGERGDAGARQNPVAAGLGTATGVGLSLLAPLPKFTAGAKGGAAARVLANAKTGASYGALNSAAGSRGNLTDGDFAQVLKDAVGTEGLGRSSDALKQGRLVEALLEAMGSGALGGAATGGALSGAAEGARATGITTKLSEYLKTKALDRGRKVLTNGADQLSTRKPLPDDVVEEAIRSGGIKPLGTTEGAHQRLGQAVDKVDAQRAELLSQLEARGVTGPDARRVAEELLAKARDLAPNTLNNALPAKYVKEAENLLSKAGPQGQTGLRQMEKLKSSAQEMARYGRVEETPINNINRDIASVLRKSNEDVVESAGRWNLLRRASGQSKDDTVARLAEEFVPVKQKLGRLLQAEEAAQRGVQRAATRGATTDFGVKSAAAAVASGQPGLLVAGPLSNFARARLPSTAATGGLGLSDLLRNPAAGGGAGRNAELVANALRPDSGLSASDRELLEAYVKAMSKGAKR